MNKNQRRRLEVGATYQTGRQIIKICKKIDRASNKVWFEVPGNTSGFYVDETGFCPFFIPFQEDKLKTGEMVLVKRPPLWTRFVNKLKSIFG